MDNEAFNWHITGFTDGEGSFTTQIGKSKTYRLKYHIRPVFAIVLRHDDKEILERIQATLKCGKMFFNIRFGGRRQHSWIYVVQSRKDLIRYIIPFFDKHPLQTKKSEAYKIWREIVLKLNSRKHLYKDELINIFRLIQKMDITDKRQMVINGIIEELSLKP